MVSPANLSRKAAATSKAITFSMTTLAALTAQISERSYWLVSGCLVLRSTEGRPLRMVLIGFMAPRTMRGMPFVIPPSSPPALLEERVKPSAGEDCFCDGS